MSKQGKYETGRPYGMPAKNKSKNKLLMSLMTSVIGMVLCTSMLMGTTMAWFTDTVTVTGNQIQTGTLSVGIALKTGENTWDPMKDESEIVAGEPNVTLFDSSVVWMPGDIAVRQLMITNKEALPLRYVLNLIKGAKVDDAARFFHVYVTKVESQENIPAYITNPSLTDLQNSALWTRKGTLDTIFTSGVVMAQSAKDGENKVIPLEEGDSEVYALAFYFDTAATLDNASDRQIELAIKLNAYQANIDENEITQPSTLVSSGEDLKDALSENNSSVKMGGSVTYQGSQCGYGVADVEVNGGILDGNGNTLSVSAPAEPNSEGKFDYTALSTTGGTIKNLTVDNGFRAVFLENMTEDVYLDNMKIGGEGVCYAINTGSNNGNYSMIVTNSEINGWSSFAGLKSASFTGCAFGQGGYYAGESGRLLKPYVSTTVTNCSFIKGFYLDLSALGDGCKVTLTGCTVDGNPLTAEVCTVTPDDYSADCTFYVELPEGKALADCVIFAQ